MSSAPPSRPALGMTASEFAEANRRRSWRTPPASPAAPASAPAGSDQTAAAQSRAALQSRRLEILGMSAAAFRAACSSKLWRTPPAA
jgi:hypothetical protein